MKVPTLPSDVMAARGPRVVCWLLLASISLAGCNQTSTQMATPSASHQISTANLSWTAPTTNTNGSALTDLAGYRIYYGTSRYALSRTIDVPSASTTDYAVQNLAKGTWYFAVVAYTSTGLESALSSVASKTIS